MSLTGQAGGFVSSVLRGIETRGTLLLSFHATAGKNAPTGEWDKYETPMADLLQEFAIFGDIIQATYLNFTSEIRQQIAGRVHG